MVTYELGSPLSAKIFNFNNFVNNLAVDDFLKDPNILPCKCENSSFTDKHHGHIVTGDLRIISNNHFRKIFSKGPKYRENRPIDLDKARCSVLSGLETCVNTWCEKHGICKSFFSTWMIKIKDKINDKVNSLKQTLITNKYYNSILSPHVKIELDKIHNDFVVVPIDKATGNIALICKRFYAYVIVKELGLMNSNANNTYKVVTKILLKIL